MKELVLFLNDNSGAIQVLFSALVTLATLVYAFLTWKLVSETRRMRKAQTDAKITVGVSNRKESISFLDFFVRNEGVGPAYDVRFEVGAMDAGKGDESLVKKINSLGFIERGVEYLSPNQEIRSFLTSMMENFEKKIETSIRIKVRYRTASGDQINDSFLLDLSVFRNLQSLGKPDLYSIAKDVEKIQQDIHNLATGFWHLNIIMQSKSEYLAEEKTNMEEAHKFFEEKRAQQETESEKEGKT